MPAVRLDKDKEGRDVPRVLISAQKCLALIERMAEEPGAVGLSELARSLDALPGTIHQQLQTLLAAGWVQRTPDSRYQLTLRALVIGNAVLEQADLGSRVIPTLTTLAAETRETASIAVIDGTDALILQRVAADQVLRVDIKPGTRMPLDRSASGRILTAQAPFDEIGRLRAQGATIADDAVLEEARVRGWAAQVDEYIEGMASVAVPVSPTKLGIVALAITGPSSRLRFDRALEALRAAEPEIAQVVSA